MIDTEALYPTKVVALNIFKRPVTAITQALYHGKIQRPATRCATTYLWSYSEIRRAAIALGALDAMRDYFRESNEALREEQRINLA